MEASPNACRKILRQLFKSSLKIGYGQSSTALEARLKTAMCLALRSFSPEDRLRLCTGEAIPWLTEDEVKKMCANVLEPADGLVAVIPEPEKKKPGNELERPQPSITSSTCILMNWKCRQVG